MVSQVAHLDRSLLLHGLHPGFFRCMSQCYIIAKEEGQNTGNPLICLSFLIKAYLSFWWMMRALEPLRRWRNWAPPSISWQDKNFICIQMNEAIKKRGEMLQKKQNVKLWTSPASPAREPASFILELHQDDPNQHFKMSMSPYIHDHPWKRTYIGLLEQTYQNNPWESEKTKALLPDLRKAAEWLLMKADII